MSAIEAVRKHMRENGAAPAPHLRPELRELRRRVMEVRKTGVPVELSPYLRVLMRLSGEKDT